VGEVVAGAPRDHWLERCRAAKVPAAPCSSYREIGEEQSAVGRHLRDNSYLLTAEHRHFGPMATIGPPTEFQSTPTAAGRGGSWNAPLLGEHNMQVLLGAAGYSREEAEGLVASGVCPRPEPRFTSYTAKL